jgi:predicted DNA-binding transcriptional regulator AlpA
MQSKRIITGTELAKLCRVSKRTVSYWLSTGRGPKAMRLGGARLIRYDMDEVTSWLSQQ